MGEAQLEGQVVFDLYEQDDISGEDELKKIANLTYGGGGQARQSFCSLLCRRRGSVIIKVLPISAIGALFALILVVMKTLWECPDNLKKADELGIEYNAQCWFLPE